MSKWDDEYWDYRNTRTSGNSKGSSNRRSNDGLEGCLNSCLIDIISIIYIMLLLPATIPICDFTMIIGLILAGRLALKFLIYIFTN